MVVGHGSLQLAGPLVGDLFGMLVQDTVLIELLYRLIDLNARIGEGLNQVHCVGVARLVVAAGVGIRGVGGQTEEGHGGIGSQRQHIVVILHDDGALFALPDGDVPGGGLHLVDGGVVALETGGILIGNGNVAAGSKEAVQRRTVALRDACAHDRQGKHGGHDSRKTSHDGCNSFRFHRFSSP